MKPRIPRSLNSRLKRAVGESPTEGPQDAFFFRPKKGKRSVVGQRGKRLPNMEVLLRQQGTEEPAEDGAAGFFFRPKFGKRSVRQGGTGTERSQDGAATKVETSETEEDEVSGKQTF